MAPRPVACRFAEVQAGSSTPVQLAWVLSGASGFNWS